MWRRENVTKSEQKHSEHQYSKTILWISLISVPLISMIFLESLCLGVLYAHDSLTGKDTSTFAKEHILTSPFASTPISPVPGKHYLGHLRNWDTNGWAQFLVPEALLGFKMAPNIAAYYADWLYTEDLVVTDDNGFSVDVDEPQVTLQKSADTYRVIVLGGSTVRGLGSQRPSQNIVSMLRNAIQQRALTGPNNRRVELINAGVDGYNSAQEYLYFVSDLLRFRPDLLIVYDGWNDIDISDFSDSPFRTATHREITRRAERSYSIRGSTSLSAQNIKYSLTKGDLKLGMIELPWRLFHKFHKGSSTTEPAHSSQCVFLHHE